VALSGAGPAAAETLSPPLSGSWSIVGHGYGHGHGLSQYGARGAARRGLNAAQIIAFYYPGTALGSVAGSTVRVRLTDDGTDTVVNADPGLVLSWAGGSQALSAAGISRWRLMPSGTGFAVDYLPSGTTVWKRSFTTTSTAADFSRSANTIRLYQNNGSSTVYRGKVGAVRSGSGQLSINRVIMDDYVRGVIPREMPSSWEASAVQAQAIAARSYARYAVEHNASNASDICDTTSCQVYGGMSAEEPGSDAAVTATAGRVARYGSATIFAQFSASNGGWLSDGGQPYLVAKADPYEAFSGDPYLSWQRQVSIPKVASYYGLTSLQSIRIDQRDGHGEWGGRVLKATVIGKYGSTARSVPTSGATLASAMGLPHNWFTSAGNPFGQTDSVRTGPGTVTSAGWAIDPDTSAPIMVQMYLDGRTSALTWASTPRPDVAAAFPTAGPNHGFTLTMRTTPGAHTVCLIAINNGPGTSTGLGCKAVNVPSSNPIGHVDSTSTAPGKVTERGWALDPDTSAPIIVQMYIDGRANAMTRAGGPRPDIAAAFPAAGPNHGFSLTMSTAPGAHTVCLYAINIGPGTTTRLSCHAVSVP
jgi:SpoIID/LytB domain protein